MNRLSISDLVVEYTSGGYSVRPIDGLNHDQPPGTLSLLLGPSGCGKTTLLSCLGGILKPLSGAIRFGDIDVMALSGDALNDYRRRTVGIVFQAFNLVPSLDAVENVMLPMRSAGIKTKPARARAVELLNQVGLEDRLDHRPGNMSGGQQQRVAIARALALDPPLLLADEPTAHLDYIQVEGVLRILRSLADGGRTIVVSTHDERMLPLADTVVEMKPRFLRAPTEPQQSRFGAGQVIFTQGSRGELIYVIQSGYVDITRTRGDGATEHLATFGPGQHFGEMGPLFGMPRSASATARADVVLTGYTVEAFRNLLGVEHLGQIIAGAYARARPGDAIFEETIRLG